MIEVNENGMARKSSDAPKHWLVNHLLKSA
jgi:hypothetical protein